MPDIERHGGRSISADDSRQFVEHALETVRCFDGPHYLRAMGHIGRIANELHELYLIGLETDVQAGGDFTVQPEVPADPIAHVEPSEPLATATSESATEASVQEQAVVLGVQEAPKTVSVEEADVHTVDGQNITVREQYADTESSRKEPPALLRARSMLTFLLAYPNVDFKWSEIVEGAQLTFPSGSNGSVREQLKRLVDESGANLVLTGHSVSAKYRLSPHGSPDADAETDLIPSVKTDEPHETISDVGSKLSNEDTEDLPSIHEGPQPDETRIIQISQVSAKLLGLDKPKTESKVSQVYTKEKVEYKRDTLYFLDNERIYFNGNEKKLMPTLRALFQIIKSSPQQEVEFKALYELFQNEGYRMDQPSFNRNLGLLKDALHAIGYKMFDDRNIVVGSDGARRMITLKKQAA